MIKFIKLITIIFFLSSQISFADGYLSAKNGIEWNSKNKTYTALGDVIFKNDIIKASSDKMIAKYIEENSKEVFTIVEFFNNIVINFQDEIFKGDYAIYKKMDNIIKLEGSVSIESATRLLTGDNLIVDLNNNTRSLNSNNSNSIVEVLIENDASN